MQYPGDDSGRMACPFELTNSESGCCRPTQSGAESM